jgi:hypothetical protein
LANRVGEVIEASTSEFLAQCYELEGAPPFGSLVKTQDGATEIYAIIYNAETASIDPERRPIARGKDEAEEADIFRHNPQLAKLLRTNFNALVLGHRVENGVHHRLPPRPARIHSFVYICDAHEVREFTRSLDFLTILVNARVPTSVEELVAACLRQAAEAHDESHGFLVRAGKELAVLLGGQLNRLDAILRRIKQ